MATETLTQNNDETIIALAHLLQETVGKFNELDASRDPSVSSMQGVLESRIIALEGTIKMLPATGLKAAAVQARIIFCHEQDEGYADICASVLNVLEKESGLDRNECAGVYYAGRKEVAA